MMTYLQLVIPSEAKSFMPRIHKFLQFAHLSRRCHSERSSAIRSANGRKKSRNLLFSQGKLALPSPQSGHSRRLAVMFLRKHSRAKASRGQSLVETALMIPLLLILILNAVNFGYFLLVTLNLTSATRNGIEYAIQGSSTPANAALPDSKTSTASIATNVRFLIAQELGAFNQGNLNVTVCSLSLGNNGSGNSICDPSGTSADADPEPAMGFVLNRIDVSYSFQPIIPETPFTLAVLSIPACSSNNGKTTCLFNRHAEMRAMGS
jgi:TadE-like protein